MLYGTTMMGGAFGQGTIFKTSYTNVNNGDGTIFRITTNGDFTLLASFDGTNGYSPANIIQASDGNFYGTTEYGGIDDYNGVGTVFRMTSDGQITTLVRFSGTNGAYPNSLMQASNGCLYGTTGSGGQYFTGDVGSGYGTVFELTTDGCFTLLASFDSTNGAVPLAGLIEVSNSVFYGTTLRGGQHTNGPQNDGNGTFFQATTNGNLMALFSFGPGSSSSSSGPVLPFGPHSALIKASDGNYYGSAFGPNAGSIYSVRPI